MSKANDYDYELVQYLKARNDLVSLTEYLGRMNPNLLPGQHQADAAFLYRGLKFLLAEVGHNIDETKL